MIRASRIALLASAVVLPALAGGCATMGPPAQPAAPAVSPDGVKVTLLGQSCTKSAEPDWKGAQLVEVDVSVGVTNSTPAPLVIHRDQFRLVAPDGTAVKTISYGASDPVTVAPGQQPSFALRFMTRGGLRCTTPMQLETRDGVVAGDHPVTLAGLRFQPENPS
jgi:hypothetical protein